MAWSQFWGEIRGRADTAAERCGSKASGLRVFAASKTGAITVSLWHGGDKDCFAIRIVPWCRSKFDDIPLAIGSFKEGDNSPILRLDDKVVSSYIHTKALEAMTK